jgi:serine/threonine protein phosphatase PrpC
LEVVDNKEQSGRPFKTYANRSCVGYVPFSFGKKNQDRALCMPSFQNDPSRALFGVFDGHGEYGHHVSSFIVDNLPRFISRQTDLDDAPHTALARAFVECNDALSESKVDSTFSGSTAIVAYIANGRIYMCNVGDSRAVLGQFKRKKFRTMPLSSDHTPEREDETARVKKCNGRIQAFKSADGQFMGPQRVWLADRDVPGLAMTRSFGDMVATSVGVVSTPEIWEKKISGSDRFLVLASDGVWEFISSEEVVKIVSKCEKPEEACRILEQESRQRWKKEEGVIDDITSLVIIF